MTGPTRRLEAHALEPAFPLVCHPHAKRPTGGNPWPGFFCAPHPFATRMIYEAMKMRIFQAIEIHTVVGWPGAHTFQCVHIGLNVYTWG